MRRVFSFWIASTSSALDIDERPMTYLAGWRLARAADLLRGTDEPVEAVGRRVGYANPFAFSTAFRRRYGVPPRSYRRAPLA